MRRLIHYLNSLFLGVILGMIFVAVVHAGPMRWPEKIRTAKIIIVHEHGCALRK